MSADTYKEQAAAEALRYVRPGMNLGLGTGSTAAKFVDLLGGKVAEGLRVVCVPTSEATAAQAAALNIPLTTLDERPYLDLTVDGTDEVDNDLQLIKGGGGALLREKIVAAASERMIVIADSSKLVEKIGGFPLPIEVVPFGLAATQSLIRVLAAEVDCEGAIDLRRNQDGTPFRTDGGNHILDCSFGAIDDPDGLASALSLVPGVVDHGLFLGLADMVIIAGPDGVSVLQDDDDS